MRKSISWNCYLIKKANCIFALSLSWSFCPDFSFSIVLPFLFMALVSCTGLHTIEVASIKVLRRILHLHYHIHTGIVHLVTRLDSLSILWHRFNSLLRSVHLCMLVRTIFCESSSTCYSCGYNNLFYHHHLKRYDYQ